MDYEKLYKEALGKAKKYLEDEGFTEMADVFPELSENEEERIRKALIEVFKEKLERGFEWVEYGIPNRSVLSWLEKQKEQNPVKLSPKDYERLPNELVSICNDIIAGRILTLSADKEGAARLRAWLQELNKEQKPAKCPDIEELSKHIKEEFESFRNLLKKKGIDYKPSDVYWTDFAHLFISSAKKFHQPVEWDDYTKTNLDKETGETCQDRNIRQSLNGVRKLLKGEELTGMERSEKLQPSPLSDIDAKAPDKLFRVDGWITNKYPPKVKSYIEYIRKDTTLEWMKKEIEKWSSESNTAQGVKMGLTLVMDKIKSL